jgi:pyruvate dehydrogenase E2 component (dihydrolipoamide acetyltransferase)
MANDNASTIEVLVPDVGDFTDIPVIELLVNVGDTVAFDDPLVTLESDKAIMEVPAPQAGTITAIHVAVGDTVSEGSALFTLEASEAASSADAPQPAHEPAPEPSPRFDSGPNPDHAPSTDDDATPMQDVDPDPPAPSHANAPKGDVEPDPRAPSTYRTPPTEGLPSLPGRRRGTFHATPSVRRFARELGVDLTQVKGTGRKGRMLRDDISRYVKTTLASTSSTSNANASGTSIPPIPQIDFSRFGDIETKPLSRIKRLTGTNLRRAWLNVPLVTHRDEADVTELEAFRTSIKAQAEQRGVRVTSLAFIIKSLVAALGEFPTFNASLSGDGESLIMKKYFHVGIAVDTPNGLVVPVIRNADTKSIFDLAREMAELSERARDGKLKIDDMSGACMSISSLGGIGGTAFTPLVNAPEVAILGVARSKMTPVWDGMAFVPRLMLPLCLSYDHRVIDGAEGARFSTYLCDVLGDVRRLLL